VFILGIDPGMARTGTAGLLVVNGFYGEKEILSLFSFVPKNRQDFVQVILDRSEGLVREPHEFVVIEEPYYNRMNPKGYATQAAMVAVLEYALSDMSHGGLDVRGDRRQIFRVTPAQARTSVGCPEVRKNKGPVDPHERVRWKKQQVRDGLYHIFGKEKLDAALAMEKSLSGKEACCDALAIAYAGWILNRD